MAKEVRESLVFEYEDELVVDSPGMTTYYENTTGILAFHSKYTVLNSMDKLQQKKTFLVNGGNLRSLKRNVGPKKAERIRFLHELYLYTEETVDIYLDKLGLTKDLNIIRRHKNGEFIEEPEKAVKNNVFEYDYRQMQIRTKDGVVEINAGDLAKAYRCINYDHNVVRWKRWTKLLYNVGFEVKDRLVRQQDWIPLEIAIKVFSNKQNRSADQEKCLEYLESLKVSAIAGAEEICDEQSLLPTPFLTIEGCRCYVDENNQAWLNVEDVARGLGFTELKNGVEYVRWRTVDSYLKEFGFSQEVAKDDYIPENIFYRLAMKANNKTAKEFQAIVCDKILPDLRRKWSSGQTYEEAVNEFATDDHNASRQTLIQILAENTKMLQKNTSMLELLLRQEI